MTTKGKPIWTPYNPDDCVGDFGWIWDKDSGEWLLCATVEPDGFDADLVLVFPSRTQVSEDWHCDPDDWSGDPYISCSAPTIAPGECDGLEVVIRFGGGASATHAIGQGDRVEQIIDGLNGVLLPKAAE